MAGNAWVFGVAMLSLFMMDLDRTEVLKGPQGTSRGPLGGLKKL